MLEPNMMKLVESCSGIQRSFGTIRHEASVEGTGNRRLK
jgi:hypothetical protein